MKMILVETGMRIKGTRLRTVLDSNIELESKLNTILYTIVDILHPINIAIDYNVQKLQ